MTEGVQLYPKRVSEQVGDLKTYPEGAINLSEAEKD